MPAPRGTLRQKACHVGMALENHPDLRESRLSGGLRAGDGRQEGIQVGFVQGVGEQTQCSEKAPSPCRSWEVAKARGRRRDTPPCPCGVISKQTFPK